MLVILTKWAGQHMLSSEGINQFLSLNLSDRLQYLALDLFLGGFFDILLRRLLPPVVLDIYIKGPERHHLLHPFFFTASPKARKKERKSTAAAAAAAVAFAGETPLIVAVSLPSPFGSNLYNVDQEIAGPAPPRHVPDHLLLPGPGQLPPLRRLGPPSPPDPDPARPRPRPRRRRRLPAVPPPEGRPHGGGPAAPDRRGPDGEAPGPRHCAEQDTDLGPRPPAAAPAPSAAGAGAPGADGRGREEADEGGAGGDGEVAVEGGGGDVGPVPGAGPDLRRGVLGSGRGDPVGEDAGRDRKRRRFGQDGAPQARAGEKSRGGTDATAPAEHGAGGAGAAEGRDRPGGRVAGPPGALARPRLPRGPDSRVHAAHFLGAHLGRDGAHLLLPHLRLLHARLRFLPADVPGALVRGVLPEPVCGQAGEADAGSRVRCPPVQRATGKGPTGEPAPAATRLLGVRWIVTGRSNSCYAIRYREKDIQKEKKESNAQSVQFCLACPNW